MTVKQLILKLNKLPEDAEVIVGNYGIYKDGMYKAPDIEFYDEFNEVLIDSDYEETV